MSDTEMAYRATLDGSGYNSGLSGMQSSLTNFNGSLGTATGGISDLAGSLGMVASPAGIAAAGLTAVGAGIAASISTAGDFQQKMAGVNAILGGSAADMQTLSTAAREAGASTSFSASQAADALGYMAGAGWDVQQSTVALQDTLTLAAAGGMDLAQAGDLMTGTVAQFGLAATDSARVANTLAAGASETNTSVSQLGAGMTVVGATANAFGMSLESTTAALGSLSNANIKGAEGGTALRGILASLATQSGTASAALAELGVTNEQINPEMVSLGDAMQLLQDRGMTASQAIAIFGRENVSAATNMAAHASELDGLEQSITGTSKAAEMAATMTDTYQGAMGELSSAVEEAEIALGTALLPIITDTVDLMTAGVTAATDFGKSISDAYTEFQTGTVAELDESFLGWLGVDTGEATAEGIATGIENEAGQVADAIEDATGGAEALAAVEAAGADTGETWVKSFGDAAEKGMTLVNGQWTSQAAAVADKVTEQNVYLNEQEYILQTIVTTQGAYYNILDATTRKIEEASGYMRDSNTRITPKGWAESLGYETEITKKLKIDWIVDEDKALESKFSNLGEQAGRALEDGIIDVTEQDTLAALAAEYTKMGGDASDALIAAVQAGDWNSLGSLIGQETGKGFAEGLGMSLTNELENFDWSAALSSSFADTAGISDLGSFAEAVFQPELVASASENLDLWNTGIETNRDQVRDNISIMERVAVVNSWLYTPDQLTAIEKYLDKKIDEKTLLEELSNAQTDLNSAVQETVATVESFVGATVNYPTYREQADEDWAASALINAQDPRIARVGSINQYSEYAEDSLAAKGITAKDPILSRIDEIIEGMDSAEEGTSQLPQTLLNTASASSECAVAIGELESQLTSTVDVLATGIFQTSDIKFKKSGTSTVGTLAGSGAQEDTSARYLQETASTLRTISSRVATAALQTTTSNNMMARHTVLNAALQTTTNAAAQTVSTAVGSAADAIIAVLYELLGAMGGGGGESSGGGSGGGGGGYSPTFSDFGTGGGPYWNTTPFFSEGGYASKAMLAVVGDSPGGEYMVPAQKLESFLATMSSAHMDTTGLQDQIRGMEMPAVHVPVVLDVDSTYLKATIERVLYEVFENVRVP
jgi:TP901 family phage tail tape measure protein